MEIEEIIDSDKEGVVSSPVELGSRIVIGSSLLEFGLDSSM